MSVIFPGNYVAHLNAYRDQGVFALPGIEFYQAIGAPLSRLMKPVSGSKHSESKCSPPTCVRMTSLVSTSL